MAIDKKYAEVSVGSTVLRLNGGSPLSTITLDHDSNVNTYILTGTATLGANLAFADDGSYIKGQVERFEYQADVTPSGNTITFLGTAMPTELYDKDCIIEAFYDGSSWDVKFLPDANQTAYIPADALVNQNLLVGEGVTVTSKGTPASTTETELFSETIVADTLDEDGDYFIFEASGLAAANANTKTMRFKVDGITVASNSTTTAPNGLDWLLRATVYRTAVDQYDAVVEIIFDGVATELVTQANQGLAGAWSSNIAVSITGENGTASANDILLYNARVTPVISKT